MARTLYHYETQVTDLCEKVGGVYTQWFTDLHITGLADSADPPGQAGDTLVFMDGSGLDIYQEGYQANQNSDPGVANVKTGVTWKYRSPTANRIGELATGGKIPPRPPFTP